MHYEQMTESVFTAKIQSHLEQILGDASLILKTLHEKDQCLLCELDDLGRIFQNMHGIASSFYLQSYIEQFTPSFVELAKAIKNLSENKHGALIVIERTDSVDKFIQKGTSLHAEISASLIESIFFPGNPLHDGALLVRENTLVSAGNVLPLTTQEVDIHLGTRHRAALGMSGYTDALVLVVSEETGKMSFAKDGVLYPLISPRT
ncbi:MULTISPECIES: sporulation-specific diadenylate cyclase CdaS [Bacillus]|uniref:sporulation-specific diadenylate cyclase CdaS n=1 Tax=Bacillus TaxID=1386 RepID=UPI002DBB710F|nr:sporulation-specific diadenylate cyclase CdaS [Bacillus mojavensis]MEC1614561.1 sporulation-specific diadenylate cyclase CdaS [Bacillus mojavensis]MEC1685506.1 sporulation-specific diadenylate cyclase CdaS [Bacillus mojavensis]MEC1690990.1 sporulation-specific diadenylate cyclase CdaS [Bacillus mojavensis]MEC1734045.1 sporulation-specific diadenylate cyclase CdaS [Bacillus mojavensis]MED1006526.1 sporulation-specific diadenylate cyclase CdaS [Bacillus mojavensis]